MPPMFGSLMPPGQPVQSIGDVLQFVLRNKGLNPTNTTEGARPYYGGGEVVPFAGGDRIPIGEYAKQQGWNTITEDDLRAAGAARSERQTMDRINQITGGKNSQGTLNDMMSGEGVKPSNTPSPSDSAQTSFGSPVGEYNYENASEKALIDRLIGPSPIPPKAPTQKTLPPGPGYEAFMDKASREFTPEPDASGELPHIGEFGSPQWKANQRLLQAGTHMESTNGSLIPIPSGLNLSPSDHISLRADAMWNAPAGQRTQWIQQQLSAMKPTDADRYARAVREQKFSPKGPTE